MTNVGWLDNKFDNNMGGSHRISKSQVGIKKALEQSAVYPRDFAWAIAGLLPVTGKRPSNDEIDVSYQGTGSDLGALDDLLKGPRKTWWRLIQ